MDKKDNITQFFPDKPQRPTLLTVICILSFIGSGLSGITFFMVYVSFEEMAPMLQEISSGIPGMELLARATKNFFLAGAVLYLFSYIGINLMWRMKKVGFHFYTGAQIFILVLPIIYIPDFPFPFLDALITALFVVMYARHYKLFQ
jgi:hypothetical protein